VRAIKPMKNIVGFRLCQARHRKIPPYETLFAFCWPVV
jgi:hypothetical protein